MIKGFVFDLDGVLTDTAEYHYEAWKNLADRIGISIDREFNETLKGISRMDSLERILVHGKKQMDYTQNEKEELAAEKNEEYKQLIKKITPKDLLPGVRVFLEKLKKEEMLLALASASKNGPPILKQLEIDDFFDAIVDPAKLTNGKPDPEIFQKGCRQLNLQPKECIGIEDAKAGIESINAAGLFSVGIGDSIVLQGADLILSSTEELNYGDIIEAATK